MQTIRYLALGALLWAPAAAAQSARGPLAAPATVSAISTADLRSRLFAVAHDSMGGRAAGTEGNLKVTAYLAAELRRLGLQPAGDNGTYFQNIPLVHYTLDPASHLSVGGHQLAAADWVVPPSSAEAHDLAGTRVIYGGTWGGSLISAQQASGKIVVISPPSPQRWPIFGGQLTDRFPSAAAVVYANLEDWPASLITEFRRGRYALRAASAPESRPAHLLVTRRAAAELLGADPASLAPGAAGRIATMRLLVRERPAPARNVAAILPGSDPSLRAEYVAIGAHSDHDPPIDQAVDHDSLRALDRVMRPNGVEDPEVRGPLTAEQNRRFQELLRGLRSQGAPRRDSINNGADDDGSGTVAVLEIAEALAAAPTRPRRSILFVWHTGEELGLLGSKYFTDHPPVDRGAITAQLNMDMVGRGGSEDTPRGGPNYLELVGSRRLSSEMGELIDEVNRGQPQPFEFNYEFDANGHPKNIYCRSDHYMYARYGIPITFFTTGGHFDYHLVTDEPQYIDYDHMIRVTNLVHDILLRIANRDARLTVDGPVPDPNAPCRQ